MATPEQVSTLRQYVNEPDPAGDYSDERLGELIDAFGGDLRKAAARVWSTKAAKYADLTDVQEGSSRRSLGDLYEQAIAMSKHWAAPDDSGAATLRPGRTRAIERP